MLMCTRPLVVFWWLRKNYWSYRKNNYIFGILTKFYLRKVTSYFTCRSKITDLFLTLADLFLPLFGINKRSLFFNILSILENFKFLPTFIKVVYFDPLVASNFKYCKMDQLLVAGLNEDFWPFFTPSDYKQIDQRLGGVSTR